MQCIKYSNDESILEVFVFGLKSFKMSLQLSANNAALTSKRIFQWVQGTIRQEKSTDAGKTLQENWEYSGNICAQTPFVPKIASQLWNMDIGIIIEYKKL